MFLDIKWKIDFLCLFLPCLWYNKIVCVILYKYCKKKQKRSKTMKQVFHLMEHENLSIPPPHRYIAVIKIQLY